MDVTNIKAINIKKILDVLRFSQGKTKNEIALHTGLSFSTVSNMCNELKEYGILADEKVASPTIGRVPNIQIFHRDRFGAICVDFHKKNQMDFSILNFSNEVLFRCSSDISDIKSTEALVDCVEELCRQREACPWGFQIVGIGVSIAGKFNERNNRIVCPAYPLLHRSNFKELMEQRLGIPCHIQNVAGLCALSFLFDNTNDQDILYLHSDDTLELGVICNGQLLQGHNSYASEIAHIPLGSKNLVCPVCQRAGCIENDLALPGMFAFNAMTPADASYTAVRDEKAEKLTLLLQILSNIFDPVAIYIGGRGFSQFSRIEDIVYENLIAHSMSRDNYNTRIVYDTNSTASIGKGVIQMIYTRWNIFQPNGMHRVDL